MKNGEPKRGVLVLRAKLEYDQKGASMSADVRDRLTLGEGPLSGPRAEPDADASSPKRNRAFVYIAVAMGGLVLLGILSLVAALQFWLPAQKDRQIAAVTSTVQARTRVAVAWTATPTPSATPKPPTATPTLEPTQTLAPTATATRVVGQGQPAGQQATKTATPALPSSTPAAGLGVGGMAAAATGLTGLLFVARKLRGQG
jgi:hypothetical protein